MTTNLPEQASLHSVSRSQVEMTQIVLPQYTNQLGNVFGGQIMSWIDICAAVAAQRHCRSQVVTASIDAVNFHSPIKQGHIVLLRARVTATFTTSLECEITVFKEDPMTGEREQAVKAFATFVSLNNYGLPKKIPQLKITDAAEKERRERAIQRREQRLKMRKQES